ncbi:hypothetical protein CBM2626_B160011 [Cupriavidus taiwanensis]|nr:hypothetical protein CBM2626_B160011 [Cupriavidus taiwanensis]
MMPYARGVINTLSGLGDERADVGCIHRSAAWSDNHDKAGRLHGNESLARQRVTLKEHHFQRQHIRFCTHDADAGLPAKGQSINHSEVMVAFDHTFVDMVESARRGLNDLSERRKGRLGQWF